MAGVVGVGLVATVLLTSISESRADDSVDGDVVVCVDVSRSMLSRDVGLDRLSRAKKIVGELVERGGFRRMGLVVFAGEAQLTYPLTTDHRAVLRLLRDAGPYSLARGGSDLNAPLELCLEGVFDDKSESRRRVILITDVDDASEVTSPPELFVSIASIGTESGGRIPVINDVGEEQFLLDGDGGVVVTRPDFVGLERLAEKSGGLFVRVSDETEVSNLLGFGSDTNDSIAYDHTVLIVLAVLAWLIALACGAGGRL